MKVRIIGLMAIISLSFTAMAQETFTDEELGKYATVMKWVDQEKAGIVEFVKTSVADNELLSGAKYNSLSKADKAGDVTTVEATAEELEAYMVIKEGKDKRSTELSTTSKEKILSDIGAGLYNRLKKALKTDEEVKARYQAIFDSLESTEMEESEG